MLSARLCEDARLGATYGFGPNRECVICVQLEAPGQAKGDRTPLLRRPIRTLQHDNLAKIEKHEAERR